MRSSKSQLAGAGMNNNVLKDDSEVRLLMESIVGQIKSLCLNFHLTNPAN